MFHQWQFSSCLIMTFLTTFSIMFFFDIQNLKQDFSDGIYLRSNTQLVLYNFYTKSFCICPRFLHKFLTTVFFIVRINAIDYLKFSLVLDWIFLFHNHLKVFSKFQTYWQLSFVSFVIVLKIIQYIIGIFLDLTDLTQNADFFPYYVIQHLLAELYKKWEKKKKIYEMNMS